MNPNGRIYILQDKTEILKHSSCLGISYWLV